jgi:WD40 repeat protein
VKGVAGGPSVAGSDRTVATLAWSRPTGKSIVYAPGADTSLKKLHIDGAPTQDISPLSSSKHLSVNCHPSGEAFASAVERGGTQSIWIASNTGKTPVQLVFSNEGTKFGAIAFDVDGKHLLYAALHADNHPELHTIDVTDTTKAPVIWAGEVGRKVLDIEPGLKTGTVAWTAGTSCADSVAMAHSPAGTVDVLPGVDGPTRAVGWLGATQLLVAQGGCDEPVSLSAIDVASGTIVPLISRVDAAAARTPVPTPPAPLPASVATLGSGFS